jgi:hypothetical protein
VLVIVVVMKSVTTGCTLLLAVFLYPPVLLADELAVLTQPLDTRYGVFGWLDHRSEYGQGVFPEPFLVDDSDLEPAEARLDWLHTAAGSQQSDEAKVEAEKGFGVVTLELEVPFERQVSPDGISQGLGNIDVGIRCPFYQFVATDGFIDSTLGIAAEVGIPTGSEVSWNTELVPKLFNDLKIGDITLQSVFGYSTLFGPSPDGGLQAFEYGFVFGYTLPHRILPLPAVQELIPIFELIGETELNTDNPGQNSVLGIAGFRLNLKAVGQMQPRPGVGFVFPINEVARNDTHGGVILSLVFQF